jgi:hypothetical protein
MFELFGPFARPSPSVLPAALAAWPVLVAVAILLGRSERARAWALVGSVVGAAGSATALGLVLARPADSRILLSPLGVAARVGQLDLPLALAIDPGSAVLATAAFVVAAAIARRTPPRARSFGARRRAVLLLLTLAATLVAILGDGAATLVLGGALASLGAAALGHASGEAFVTDRVADLALVGAACVAFWLFGGSWIDGPYVPDLEPRLVVAASEGGAAHTAPDLFDEDDDDDDRPRAAARGPQSPGSLSLGSLPGAVVMVDGTWLRKGDSLLRAPFGPTPVPAGPHTLRVHVGPGSDDYYVPRVQLGSGESLALAVQGSTMTFREMTDQLAARDASGVQASRASLARRTMAPGISAAGVVLVLALLAVLARVRLLPFHSPRGDRALPLGAFVALAIAWRYGVLASLAPATASAAACALFAAASVRGLAAIRFERPHDAALGAEVAFAATGLLVNAPAAALLHGCVAALGAAGRRADRPWPRATHVALLFTRASILGACGAVSHASLLVVGLGLVATLVLSSAPSAPSSAWAWLVAALVALLVVDPRTFGHARASIADQALGKSVLPPSLALVVLLAAVVAFGVAASGRTAARLRAWSAPPLAALPSRATGAVALSASSAVTELDARLFDGLLQLGEGVIRAAGWVFARIDEALVSGSALSAPVPSERAARAVMLGLALVTLAAFSLPWLV